MFARRILTVAVAALMLTSVALGGALASSGTLNQSSNEAQASAHAGTHVAFDATADAITNYSVEGTQLLSAVEVESASDAEERGVLGVGAGLSTVTNVEAAGLSVGAESDTQVQLEAESGATIAAHDSQRGHLLVRSGDDGTLLAANLSGDAEAEQESDARVVVTKDDGTQGTFIVIGDGEVTVNEEGDVVADIEQGSSLVYQQYDGERTDEDDEREQLIANGTAAAEVYVTTAAEGGSEAAADVVQFAEDTTVEVVSHSENRIELTAERAESEGRVIVTSVSEQAFEAADEIEVAVDGEAAVQAESMSELEAAAAGGDDSAYMVRSASTAEASSEVLVAVNHFSERDVTMTSEESDDSADDGSSDDGKSDDTDDSTADDGADDGDDAGNDDEESPLPGFGVLVALIALATSGALAVRNAR